MERNEAAARHSWAWQHAWLLLHFFPFPVGQTIYSHGTWRFLRFPFLVAHLISVWCHGIFCSILKDVAWSTPKPKRPQTRRKDGKDGRAQKKNVARMGTASPQTVIAGWLTNTQGSRAEIETNERNLIASCFEIQ